MGPSAEITAAAVCTEPASRFDPEGIRESSRASERSADPPRMTGKLFRILKGCQKTAASLVWHPFRMRVQCSIRPGVAAAL